MLLAGPISHTNIQYMDFSKIFMFHWICQCLLVVVGVELPLCVVATPSLNAVTCFLESG